MDPVGVPVINNEDTAARSDPTFHGYETSYEFSNIIAKYLADDGDVHAHQHLSECTKVCRLWRDDINDFRACMQYVRFACPTVDSLKILARFYGGVRRMVIGALNDEETDTKEKRARVVLYLTRVAFRCTRLQVLDVAKIGFSMSKVHDFDLLVRPPVGRSDWCVLANIKCTFKVIYPAAMTIDDDEWVSIEEMHFVTRLTGVLDSMMVAFCDRVDRSVSDLTFRSTFDDDVVKRTQSIYDISHGDEKNLELYTRSFEVYARGVPRPATPQFTFKLLFPIFCEVAH